MITTKTRHIIQYENASNVWADRDTLHTAEEAIALLDERKSECPALTFRVVKRTTVTTDEVISTPTAS